MVVLLKQATWRFRRDLFECSRYMWCTIRPHLESLVFVWRIRASKPALLDGMEGPEIDAMYGDVHDGATFAGRVQIRHSGLEQEMACSIGRGFPGCRIDAVLEETWKAAMQI